MPRVTFTAHLRRHLPAPTSDVPGATVGAALEHVFAANPRLRSYVLDDQGRVRRHVSIWRGGEGGSRRAGLDDAVGVDEEIFVLQALSGG